MPTSSSAFEHGQASDLAFPHRVRRLLYGIFGVGGYHLAGHHVLHQDPLQGRGPLRVAERGGRGAQVPVRDYADETSPLQDGEVPDASLPAQGEGRSRRLVR